MANYKSVLVDNEIYIQLMKLKGKIQMEKPKNIGMNEVIKTLLQWAETDKIKKKKGGN